MLMDLYCASSSDSYRGVHPHPGFPCSAVPGVCGRGRGRLESRAQDGGFPDRGDTTIHYCIMGCNYKHNLEVKYIVFICPMIQICSKF